MKVKTLTRIKLNIKYIIANKIINKLKMISVKYQLRTTKVKGIHFHPQRSWIIVSTYGGEVKIIDYRLGSVLKQYTVTPDSVRYPKISQVRLTYLVYQKCRIPSYPANFHLWRPR